MYTLLKMLGVDKMPLAGMRTYIMLIIGVIIATYPDIKAVTVGAESLTDLDFIIRVGSIVVPAILAAFYKKTGVEREVAKVTA